MVEERVSVAGLGEGQLAVVASVAGNVEAEEQEARVLVALVEGVVMRMLMTTL